MYRKLVCFIILAVCLVAFSGTNISASQKTYILKVAQLYSSDNRCFKG